MDALSILPWCVLSILCNTTHVKTMSLKSFCLCSIVPGRTLNLLARIPNTFTTTPPTFRDHVVCHSLFPFDLSSAVGFNKPWHQGKGVVTQQKILHIWLSLPQRFRWHKPQSAILNFLPPLAEAKYLCI